MTNTTALEELLEGSINTGLDAIRRAPIVAYETEVRCLRIQDISNSKPFSEWGFTETKDTDYEKYRLRTDDIIMARTCSTGICYLVKNDMSAVFNNGLARVRVDKNRVDPSFLYYIFKSKQFEKYIDGISGGTSVQLNMKVGDLARFELRLPDLFDQKAIAHILGTLDDKIELNQKMNQTLEEIAKAIFKSWFVDFDPVRAKAEGRPTGLPPEISDLFPDDLADSDIGEIPKGWSTQTSSEFCDSVRDGTHDSPKPVSEGGHPLVTSKHIKGGILDLSSANRISTKDFVAVNKRSEVSGGDVLISMIGTLGELYFVDENPTYAIKNIGLFKAKSKESGLWFYLFLKSRASQEYLKISAQGSTQQYLSLKTLRNIPVISPSKSVLDNFSLISSPIFKRIKTAKDEIKTLSELRDTLLPKLISGELRIPDAEKFLEEAGI